LDYVEVAFRKIQQIFRNESIEGKLDTPKTHKSIRVVALSASVSEDLESWLAELPRGEDTWVFPSEKLNTPLSKDNAGSVLVDRPQIGRPAGM
jgi:hypothetical protein